MESKFEVLVGIAEQYGCVLKRDLVHCDRNQGACAGNELWLGEFDRSDIEVAAFFHELGHYVSGEDLGLEYWLCTISCEAVAWEYGFMLANKHGFDFSDYYCEGRKYARKCLSSYNKPESFL